MTGKEEDGDMGDGEMGGTGNARNTEGKQVSEGR